MKKRTLTAATVAVLVGLAGADLVPETLTITNTRNEASVAVNTNVSYLAGSSLQLTNCLALISATSTQDLTGCGVQVRIGNNRTNVLYVGNLQDASNGTWNALVTIPTSVSGECRIQVALTNGAIRFIYPGDKTINTRSALE
jgi:hypothetical protein